ncbi:MAG: preprotein translocase subunit SecG [bacterium]
MVWADYINCVVAVLLIIVVMAQGSKDDIKDAFSGEKSDLFKNQKARGIDKFLNVLTSTLAITFIVLVVISRSIQR